jgi:glutamine amidotransferase
MRNKKIAVLDYGIGNVRSVRNALSAIGADVQVTSDPDSIRRNDGLVLPGVGSFPAGMALLAKHELPPVLFDHIRAGKPLLGICLGMQMLFETGLEFGTTEGLGVIPGRVGRIPLKPSAGRLPHVAWTTIQRVSDDSDPMFLGLDDMQCRFYFVHSYAAIGVPPNIINGIAHYHGHVVTASVRLGNVWGTQFHPEKSGPHGLVVLSNFAAIC